MHLHVSPEIYLALQKANLLRSFRLYSYGEYVDGIAKPNGLMRVWLKDGEYAKEFKPNFIPEERKIGIDF